jgi:hypothetical protein
MPALNNLSAQDRVGYTPGSPGNADFTFTFDSGTGSDRLLVAGIRSVNGADITALKYAGVDCEYVGASAGFECWRLPAHAEGSNALTWTCAGESFGNCFVTVASFTGALQTPTSSVTPATGAAAGAGTRTTGVITCPDAGLIWGALNEEYTTTDITGTGLLGQTRVSDRAQGHSTRASTGAVVWTTDNLAFNWWAVALPIEAAVAEPPVITGPTGSAGDPTVSLTVAENQTAIGTWTVTDGATWGVSGTDAALVQIAGGVVSFLTPKNFEAPDDAGANGVYNFNVTNGSASQAVTVTLTNVVEPPGPPTGVVATPGNGSASVAFTAPVANGGPSVTGYTVTSSPGGFTGTGPASPIVVTGLTNGVPYTFTVTATNSEDTSSASVASSAVTPQDVFYTATVGPFAPNTGAGIRSPGAPFAWWATTAGVGGDWDTSPRLRGIGVLDSSGMANITTLTTAGVWTMMLEFTDDAAPKGSAKINATAA